VADLADLVSLSLSAFAHLFRDVTGRSPYQFRGGTDSGREQLRAIGFTV
jgi:AraC-like DNA-binding protein